MNTKLINMTEIIEAKTTSVFDHKTDLVFPGMDMDERKINRWTKIVCRIKDSWKKEEELLSAKTKNGVTFTASRNQEGFTVLRAIFESKPREAFLPKGKLLQNARLNTYKRVENMYYQLFIQTLDPETKDVSYFAFDSYYDYHGSPIVVISEKLMVLHDNSYGRYLVLDRETGQPLSNFKAYDYSIDEQTVSFWGVSSFRNHSVEKSEFNAGIVEYSVPGASGKQVVVPTSIIPLSI